MLIARLSDTAITASPLDNSSGDKHTRLIINGLDSDTVMHVAVKSMPENMLEKAVHFVWGSRYWKPITIKGTDGTEKQVLINVNSLIKRVQNKNSFVAEETILDAVNKDNLGRLFSDIFRLDYNPHENPDDPKIPILTHLQDLAKGLQGFSKGLLTIAIPVLVTYFANSNNVKKDLEKMDKMGAREMRQYVDGLEGTIKYTKRPLDNGIVKVYFVPRHSMTGLEILLFEIDPTTSK
jgi:hypothetical protein